jgi:outer membrane assembly lipoprotein YfgL
MKRLLGLAAALLLAACASEKPPLAPLDAYQPGLQGERLWSASVGKIEFPLTPAVRDGQFIVASSNGSVMALDVASGREIWRSDAGAPLTAGVGSDGRNASVVTAANELVTFESGKPLWRQRLPARVVTAPLVAGERVFVLAVDRSVHAFDAQDGRLLWRFQRPGDALTLAQAGVLTVAHDQLLIGQGGRLMALDALKGTVNWDVLVGNPRGSNEVERLADLIGPAVRQGDRLCMRAFQNAVGCVDVGKGTLLWTRNNAGFAAVGADAARVFGGDAVDRLTAWKADSGDTAWTNERLLHRGLSGAVVVAAGKAVVFGDVEGQVHFLSVDDGRTLLRLPTDGKPVVGTPALAGDTLLVATRDGGLFAFKVR